MMDDKKRSLTADITLCSIQAVCIVGWRIGARIFHFSPDNPLMIIMLPLLTSSVLSLAASLILPVRIAFKRALLLSSSGSGVFTILYMIVPLFLPQFDLFYLVTICGILFPLLSLFHLLTSFFIWTGSMIRSRFVGR